MFKNTGTRRSVFRSVSPLNPQNDNDEIVGREAEIERIADAIRPLASGNVPNNLLVSGPPGVGKTACVTHVLDTLAEQTRVETVYLNCWQYNTRASLLPQFLIQLGVPEPRKGKASDELLLRINEWLDKNRDMAVILDEFDQLDDATELVYDLYHASEDADNNLGIVLISNNPRPALELDPRSQSRLNCRQLEFEPYTAEELEMILRDRADDAFTPGAVDDHVLEHIAKIVANNTGDCRQAFNLLVRAGRKADRENTDTVTLEHVQQEPPRSPTSSVAKA